ncbi:MULTISPECIES: LysR substrate-binding domain-containing protein [Vibrio]|uniref:LysR family transcriptional regulator n=2 Tax=Vibrio TaxID=662 RepID=A0A7X4LHF8_9VIBR|nr:MULTISPECIES: LysR substrate-binding domain-containing protein [Vibrio]MBF9003244.1 LysR family transcriptional regulator [Vibrio nitrifigilis]MZI91967.1 LysR family transcriptional regulator [Vibrio eleionomae]
MRKLLPLKSLYTFVAVAETGSMSKAAEVLNVSHSAVSQAIKSIESQLNQTLFSRVGRNVELNNAGYRYYKKIAPALEQIVDATEAMLIQPNTNRLTVNMINSLALHWWIPRVPKFQQFAPTIDIRMSNLPGQFSLEAEGVDAAIIHGVLDDWQDYYCEKLSDDQLVLVCNPDLISEDTELEVSQLLAKYPTIVVTGKRRINDWPNWCKANDVPPPKQKNNLSFVTSAQAIQATYRQLGMFVTHKIFVQEDLEQGGLISLGSAVKHPTQGFYFTCLPEKLKLESVLTLRSWLRHEFNH